MRTKITFWTIALFLIPLSANAAADLTSNLTIYLEFNNDDTDEIDGDNIRDVSIDINTVNNTEIDGIAKGEALSNNSIVKLGARSYYLSEDTQDYIEILDNATLVGGQELTACLWIFPKAVVADTALIMKTFDPTDEWGFLADTQGQISYRFGAGVAATGTTANGIVAVDSWQLVCMVYNGSEAGNTRVEIWHNNTNRSLSVTGGTVPDTLTDTSNNILVGWWGNLAGRYYTGYIDSLAIWKRTLSEADLSEFWNNGAGTTIGAPDTTPPEIDQNSYNMTSEGGEGCTVWRTNKNIGCTTSDTTPTVSLTTIQSATCAIGTSNRNYTDLGASRECSGGGTTAHTCTLTTQDELTLEDSFIYIGCKDFDNNQNRTSTSGALRISIQSSDLEAIGRNAIETGIQHALGSGYTIYTDQKVYARNSANNQFVKTFDKVVKWLNKIWAFNFLTGNETADAGKFNITPVMYVLELTNATNSSVNSTVYNLIINTK